MLSAVLFVVTPLRIQTGWDTSLDNVERTYTSCGVPYDILTKDTFANEVGQYTRPPCVLSARTRVVNAFIFSLPLLMFGIAGIIRGPYHLVPLHDAIRPLPKLSWWKPPSKV